MSINDRPLPEATPQSPALLANALATGCQYRKIRVIYLAHISPPFLDVLLRTGMNGRWIRTFGIVDVSRCALMSNLDALTAH